MSDELLTADPILASIGDTLGNAPAAATHSLTGHRRRRRGEEVEVFDSLLGPAAMIRGAAQRAIHHSKQAPVLCKYRHQRRSVTLSRGMLHAARYRANLGPNAAR
jgi:hypothetical protein